MPLIFFSMQDRKDKVKKTKDMGYNVFKYLTVSFQKVTIRANHVHKLPPVALC
jgi:hypothetical protein